MAPLLPSGSATVPITYFEKVPGSMQNPNQQPPPPIRPQWVAPASFSSLDFNDSMPPAKRPRWTTQTASVDHDGLHNGQRDGVVPSLTYSPSTAQDGSEYSSHSTALVGGEFDHETTNQTTPNESIVSNPLAVSTPNGHSMSPSNFSGMELNSTMPSVKSSPIAPLDTSKCKPRSSIPAGLPGPVYAQQCTTAAIASRLDPFALHRGEQGALQDYLCHLHVTTYLNIRNGILRLWTRNPMVSVTKEEALGCAKEYRWMNLAAFAYEWLVRNGYINFGCVEVPEPFVPPKRGRRKDGPVIVVIGAGMSGLGCARQLESLFRHYRDSITAPRVVVLEGRRRIGGRIYSHPLQSHPASLPDGLRPKAEMGAQIIVGFEHGNPLDPIIRSQLALRYHLLRDISTIYDIDGSAVDETHDAMDERLYDDVLDRSGDYRHKPVINSTAEGDKQRMIRGRDISADDGVTVRQWEEARATGREGDLLPATRTRRGVGHKTASNQPAITRLPDNADSTDDHLTAMECQNAGWKLRDGVSLNQAIDLDQIAKQTPFQTLGAVMDEGVKQYQRILPLTPKDMRLINWHFANLEYANATNVCRLSLSGWDQDMGNEFEGEHAHVIGGYQQLPRGLWRFPSKLDVRTETVVTKVSYNALGSSKTKTVVHCENGETIAADHVVYTGSLGTLKDEAVQFDPPLPTWKADAIKRLGFGLLNKVVLVFDKPFWDVSRDMFGLLREPLHRDSLEQEDYAANRGQFYLFWNCVPTTGLPVLIALMAGDSAHQAETLSDSHIVGEVTAQLRNIFKGHTIPDPLETIITRWKSDRFTRGSYSYVAAEALPGDYDLVAKPVGNLHFAGEATCGTHPATVHGAYLSGLRAASEVIDSIYGPIPIPTPLVTDKAKPAELGSASTPSLADNNLATPQRNDILPINLDKAATNKPNPLPDRGAYDKAMWQAIHDELGYAEPRPAKIALNPFLFYQKDFWQRARDQCDADRQSVTKDPNAKAARDEIRAALGHMWRNASENEKRPYLELVKKNREDNEEALKRWKERTTEWERKTFEVKDRWCTANPFEQWRVAASVVANGPPTSTGTSHPGEATWDSASQNPADLNHDFIVPKD